MTIDTPTAGLISPSDIAELAGRSRAAVSYWRKNEQDFPQPVAGTPSRPLFDRAAIESWLSARGSLKEGGERYAIAVWAAANELRGTFAPEQISVEVHRVLALRKLALHHAEIAEKWAAALEPSAQAIHEAFEIAQRVWRRGDILASSGNNAATTHLYESGRFSRLMDAIGTVPESDLAAAGDFVLQRVAGTNARGGGVSGLPDSTTAEILVAAARKAGKVVYDPACGIAEALLEVSSASSAMQAVGIDVNESAWFIATVRALLRDSNAQIRWSDSLRRDPEPELRADTIVLEPPFGIRGDDLDPYDVRWRYGAPPKTNADLAWVQDALFHLAPRGVAYVLTPAGALFRGGREAAIRSRMLRDGAVEAIVELPPKLLSYTSIGLALWVLRPGGSANQKTTVAIIDATQETDIAKRVGAWLDGAERGAISQVPHAFVDIEALVDDGAVLSAARWVERAGLDAHAVRAALSLARSEFARAIDAFTVDRPQKLLEVPTSERISSLGEITEFDAGAIRQGSVNAGGKDADEVRDRYPTLVSTQHVKTGLPKLNNAQREAAVRTGERLTEPGDVLFTTMGTVRAVVDDEGGRIPAKGVYVLHLNRDRFDPAFVAAVLSSKWNEVHQRGTAITHAVVKDLEIPVLSLEEQQRVVAELTQLSETAQRARALAEAADRAEAAVLDVVRFGKDVDR